MMIRKSQPYGQESSWSENNRKPNGIVLFFLVGSLAILFQPALREVKRCTVDLPNIEGPFPTGLRLERNPQTVETQTEEVSYN